MVRKQRLDPLKVFSDAFYAQEKGDLDTAISLYKQASRLGFAPAQTNLGNIYDDVLDPPQPKKAVEMYRRAVKLGSRAGASCLAAHYKNLGKARWHHYWLARAAEMGEEDASRELSRLTEAGFDRKRRAVAGKTWK